MDINQALLTDVQEEISLAHGTQITLQDASLTQFSFAATMHLDQASSHAPSAFGLVIHYSEKEQIFIHFLQQEKWNLTVESTGIAPVVNRVLTLPLTFDPASPHTLRVEQQDQLSVYLNDTLVLVILETPRAAQAGLFTRDAGATFTNVQYTDLSPAMVESVE